MFDFKYYNKYYMYFIQSHQTHSENKEAIECWVVQETYIIYVFMLIHKNIYISIITCKKVFLFILL